MCRREGISFEEAVAWRKRQGFNSISFIAAFPNWAADEHGATFANKDGVYLRNAWEKFGSWAPNAKISTADGATTTAKDMHDEQGNRPFEVFADREGLANFDRINPRYFASLDRKMRHLSDQGFVPFLVIRIISRKRDESLLRQMRHLAMEAARYRRAERSKSARPSRSAKTANGRLPCSSCMSFRGGRCAVGVAMGALGAQEPNFSRHCAGHAILVREVAP